MHACRPPACQLVNVNPTILPSDHVMCTLLVHNTLLSTCEPGIAVACTMQQRWWLSILMLVLLNLLGSCCSRPTQAS